jgi:ribosomal protein S20
MPITKTAKRALRSSLKKTKAASLTISKLQASVRLAKKSANKESVLKAVSLADRAAKKHSIHKNKAARIKSALYQLLPKVKTLKKAKTSLKK